MRSVLVVLAAVAALMCGSSAFAQTPASPTPIVVAAADPAAEAKAETGPQASDALLPPAAITAPAAAEAAPGLAPPEPTLFAVIDLSSQTMTVSDASGVIASWKISSARRGYRTPTGFYTPHYTARMHYSKQYGFSPMPYSVFFNEGVAVHGTREIGNLGRPASHGCVRSHPKNAKIFYDLVQKHGMQMTRVTVKGTPPGGVGPLVAEGRRRRYATAKPVYQPAWGGMFGYSQPKKAKKKQYGGSYNTW